MRKLLIGLLVAGAAMAAPANAAVTITTGDTTNPIPTNNDYKADLNGLGLFDFTTTNASIVLEDGAQIIFEFLASESGFNDTFSTAGASPVSYTETSPSPTGENHFASPIVIGADTFASGSLAGLLNFTSAGGTSATVGEDGFGIFLPAGFTGSLSTNVFYLGYDDRINNADDNHDDFIVRATVLPEPGTWAMMLFGFGAAGFAIRRQRKPALAQLA